MHLAAPVHRKRGVVADVPTVVDHGGLPVRRGRAARGAGGVLEVGVRQVEVTHVHPAVPVHRERALLSHAADLVDRHRVPAGGSGAARGAGGVLEVAVRVVLVAHVHPTAPVHRERGESADNPGLVDGHRLPGAGGEAPGVGRREGPSPGVLDPGQHRRIVGRPGEERPGERGGFVRGVVGDLAGEGRAPTAQRERRARHGARVEGLVEVRPHRGPGFDAGGAGGGLGRLHDDGVGPGPWAGPVVAAAERRGYDGRRREKEGLPHVAISVKPVS